LQIFCLCALVQGNQLPYVRLFVLLLLLLLLLPQVCAEELLQLAAAKHSVRFVPGRACEGLPHMARLSFSFYRPQELQEGVRRLAAALADYMAGERHAEQ
jgi:DNA-binding transcriptional MocR family regulator